MPVKVVIAAGVFLVVAVGVAIYENEELREHIKDVVELSRRKTAELLHTLADNVSGAGRSRLQSMPSMSHRPSSVELGRSSGYDVNNTITRRRGSRSDSPMLFKTGSDSGASGLGEKMIGVSRRSSTSTLPAVEINEKPLPSPPAHDQQEESGYDSQHTPASPPQHPFVASQPFWSIHKWQEDAADARSSSPSLAGSDDERALSEAGSGDSTGSWTEVGSEVSADEHQ